MNMDVSTNFIPFLGTFVPAAFYALLVYLSMPKRTVPVTHAPLFFISGICAVFVVKLLYFTVPLLREPLIEGVAGVFVQNFTQVALFEESAKMLLFISALRYFTPQTPQSTVFMYMSLACGFAAAENFAYMLMFGPEVLIVRTVTALLLHMSAGVLAGRMWSLGKRKLALFLPVMLHGLYNSVVGATDDFGAAVMVGLCLTVGFVSCESLLDKKMVKS